MKKIFRVMVCLLCVVSLSGCKVKYSESETQTDQSQTVSDGYTIRLRYSDEAYTDFFEYCASQYESTHENVTIELELVDATDYIKKINTASQNETTIPDVYMLSNSDIATACLAGIAAKNDHAVYCNEEYSRTAILACSYEDELYGFPLAYSTSFLVYNKDYMDKDNVSTIETMEKYSESTDLVSNGEKDLETAFRCNISDLFITYGFMGKHMDIGGQCGDNAGMISISNKDSIADAERYKKLIDYFSLSDKVTYNSCVSKFTQGKILSTIMTPDSLKTLEKSEINYGISEFPDYDEDNQTTPISLTSALMVNPFSENCTQAGEFAWYVSYVRADDLYQYAGKLSAKKNVKYANEELGNIYASYEKSTPKNKILMGEQIYPLLEIAFHNIISGNNAKLEYDEVDDYMKNQLN